MKHVKIYTDGSCLGNPGSGGWACILKYQNQRLEKAGGEACTTNNKMELMALIAALRLLKEKCEIDVYSDSEYLVNAFNKHWLESWQRNKWKKSDGQKVKNVDLWKELLRLARGHRIRFHWVKGHNGDPENEFCDKMAREQAKKFEKERPPW